MNKAKELFRQFFDKPIAYHRIYADITKGFDTGVLLSQINYWWKTMNYKPFYKSEDSFCGELYMTKYQFRQAKDTLIALNCISVERKGLPARLYYTVNEEVIIEHITSFVKVTKLDLLGSQNKSCEGHKTIYKDKENNKENKADIPPAKTGGEEKHSGSTISTDTKKINISSVEKNSAPATPRSLDGRYFPVLKAYQKLMPSVSAKNSDIREGIPRAVKIFENFFKDEAVDKLAEALDIISKNDWWRTRIKESHFGIVKPSNFFKTKSVENNLLPLLLNSPKNEHLCEAPKSEEELREIEEDNAQRIREVMEDDRRTKVSESGVQ
jgi:hypothetical protein